MTQPTDRGLLARLLADLGETPDEGFLDLLELYARDAGRGSIGQLRAEDLEALVRQTGNTEEEEEPE